MLYKFSNLRVLNDITKLSTDYTGQKKNKENQPRIYHKELLVTPSGSLYIIMPNYSLKKVFDKLP